MESPLPAGEDDNSAEKAPGARLRKPMNSFMLFSNEMRPILQAKHRDSNNAQISKMLGTQWKAMSPQEKQPYIDAALKIKTEFKAAHPDYVYTRASAKSKKRKGDADSPSAGHVDQEFLAYVPQKHKTSPSSQRKHPQMFVRLPTLPEQQAALPQPPPPSWHAPAPLSQLYFVPMVNSGTIGGLELSFPTIIPDFSPVL